MKYLAFLISILTFVSVLSGQKVKLSGTVYDPNGSVIVGAKVDGRYEKGEVFSATSGSNGKFEVQIYPGLYTLRISNPGFLTIEYSEYLVVNAAEGMTMDLVMFGAKYHEPCGVSGSDCLSSTSLRKSYQVKYIPSLWEIRKEFSPETRLDKSKENKDKN